MKKGKPIESNSDDMREEYDFSGGERGKYAKRFKSGSILVTIDPDLARLFPNSEAVNRALRSLAESQPQYARETEPTEPANE